MDEHHIRRGDLLDVCLYRIMDDLLRKQKSPGTWRSCNSVQKGRTMNEDYGWSAPAEHLLDTGLVLMEKSMQVLAGMMEYQDLMLFYDSAIKVVQTNFDIINAAYRSKYQRNSIHSISSRRKNNEHCTEDVQEEPEYFGRKYRVEYPQRGRGPGNLPVPGRRI